MSREQQQRLVGRLGRSLVATSVVGALGLAGYLGVTTATASTGTTGSTSDQGTTTDDGSTTSFSDTYGGGTDLSPGTGPRHATTSGS